MSERESMGARKGGWYMGREKGKRGLRLGREGRKVSGRRTVGARKGCLGEYQGERDRGDNKKRETLN